LQHDTECRKGHCPAPTQEKPRDAIQQDPAKQGSSVANHYRSGADTKL